MKLSDTNSQSPNPSEANSVSLLKATLVRTGWDSEEVFVEPALRGPSGVYRPTLALTRALYPLATLEMRRSDEMADDGDRTRDELIGQSFRIQLESDGISTWQRGAKEGRHWKPAPSPQDLWNLLGREWNDSDPRLQTPISEESEPRIFQVCAVGAVLDAVDVGRTHIQLAMPQGTGKTYVALELIWKLLKSGVHRRVLFLTSLRATAEQTHARLRVLSNHFDVALLPSPDGASSAAIQIATTAAFLLPNRSRLDSLPTDFYDLIFIYDLQIQPEGWRKIVRHFPNARAIGFSADSFFDTQFGESVFRYSIDDILASEAMRAPAGFRLIRLGDVAEVTAGVHPSMAAQGKSLPLITAHSLPTDGTWIGPASQTIQGNHKVDSAEALPPWSASQVLRPRDILISAILNPQQPRIVMVPNYVSDPIYAHNSVYRIRITDPGIAPEDVLAFLRSDAGMRSIQRGASFLGGHLRITVRDLDQLPVIVPEFAPASELPFESKAEPERPATDQSLSAAGQALRELTDVVIPELKALELAPQSRDPGILAARLRDIAATLSSPPLSERVMSRYPMPIALAFRRFHDSRFNVYEQVLRLRDLFESAAFFVYNVVLADALRRLPPNKYIVSDRGARTAYDGFSMAARISFVDAVVSAARSNGPSDLFLPELCDSSFGSHAKVLQTNFRNHISHSATASESRQRALLTRYQPVVESMLESLAFLEDYRLARIASLYMQGGKYVRRVELYQGVTPAIDEQAFEPGKQPELAEYDHLVLLDENGDHVDLFPLYQFVANGQTGDDTHMCCFKQRRGKELLGESVQAPIEVQLEGAIQFETLRSRLREKA